MRLKLHALALIAAREWVEASRGRGIWIMTALLTALPLLLSAVGLGLSGAGRAQGLARTGASLVSLSNYLVPLFGLQLAQASLAGEAERGTLALLAVQPLPRRWIVLGKFAGLAALLAAVVCGSFTVAGVLVALRSGASSAGDYAVLVGSSVLLGWAFVAIGLWVSSAARDRAQALAGAFGAWLFFAVVLDLVLLGVFVAASHAFLGGDHAPSVELLHRELTRGVTGDESPLPWLSALVLVNPTGVFRLWNVLRSPALRQILAMTRSLPPVVQSPGLLAAASLAWIAGPLWCAARRFEVADL